MRTVELVPGIRSSALGFGCAPILGAVDGATARRAMGVALDEGITHFDVARSYGYGDAEAFVGRYLKSRRGEVVLATKFGIVATTQARLLRPLKPLVRWVKKQKGSPGSGGPVPGSSVTSLGDRFHRRLAMRPEQLRISVETSLRELGTDYLDYLFLHEPQEAIADMNALAKEAGNLKAAGKIRAWGLALMREQWELHMPTLEHFDVLQYDLAPGAVGYDCVKNRRASSSNVFFSPFRGAAETVSRGEVLRRLADDFPQSVILCSMFNPVHIRANAAVF